MSFFDGDMSKLPENARSRDWELEMRTDDRRIRRYLQALPAFLDLPGEEELLFKQLSEYGETPVKFDPDAGLRSSRYLAALESGNEFDRNGEALPPHPHDCRFSSVLDRLSVDWNWHFALELAGDPAWTLPGVGIAAALAQLLETAGDFQNAVRSESFELAGCLQSRGLSQLARLSAHLRQLSRRRPASLGVCRQLAAELAELQYDWSDALA